MAAAPRPVFSPVDEVELHTGDRMTREEFHRIYERTPEKFKAAGEPAAGQQRADEFREIELEEKPPKYQPEQNAEQVEEVARTDVPQRMNRHEADQDGGESITQIENYLLKNVRPPFKVAGKNSEEPEDRMNQVLKCEFGEVGDD